MAFKLFPGRICLISDALRCCGMPDGQYTLIENIAEFTIDGKTCRGILEIGFNHDRSRFFNKRNLGEIRR